MTKTKINSIVTNIYTKLHLANFVAQKLQLPVSQQEAEL
jgi:hypothetical protein